MKDYKIKIKFTKIYNRIIFNYIKLYNKTFIKFLIFYYFNNKN